MYGLARVLGCIYGQSEAEVWKGFTMVDKGQCWGMGRIGSFDHGAALWQV